MTGPDSTHSPPFRTIAIMGATATGKSQLAIDIAHRIGGEVVSIDSRQVYRGMDIGTAKVLPDEQEGIPHHLIDILDPDEPNSAGLHARLARQAIADIERRGKIPILAGGTGLYFRTLFRGIMDLDIDENVLQEVRSSLAADSTGKLYRRLQRVDPERADSLSPNDRQRIGRALEIYLATGRTMSDHLRDEHATGTIRSQKFFLTMPRFELRDSIARRTRMMFRAGWVDEVRALLDAGYASDAPGMISLGYQEITGALKAGRNPQGEIDTIITHTRQYAKRQETFFRTEKESIVVDVAQQGYQQTVFSHVRSYFHFKNNLT